MVVCCVPNCGADSWRCDGSVTFYDFPSNPDLAAKWIKQINTAIKTRPMWFPRGKPVICSKHFLHTDFKGDTDSLKPRCIPTVFGHKYIGINPESNVTNKSNESKTTPLIVKVIRSLNSIIESNDLQILDNSDVNINAANNANSSNDQEPSPEIIEIPEDNSSVSSQNVGSNLQYSSQKNYLRTSYNNISYANTTNVTPNTSNSKQRKSNTSFGKSNNVPKRKPVKQPNSVLKTFVKKKDKINSDLIEIGPNTFLKINPDIIKVNKKQTPSGNTVLQFLMDQKHAKNYSSDMLPKLIQSAVSSAQENSKPDAAIVVHPTVDASNENAVSNNQDKETVQHVLGHIVDTHACEETCADLQINDDNEDCVVMEDSEDKTNDTSNPHTADKADTSFIEKAPVLFTTSMPLSHCFIDKPKYVLQLKQKNRQIASLKFKVSTLTKKIEELEDRCIVQERQLSYSFIKRLKSIRKNAAKGDPRATYILEQIRSYSNNSKMRWSDTTLTQCAIWCRKAPYAYEYFKKADFFKLPCLGSVKRFMKKHPEIKFQKKVTSTVPPDGAEGGDDDESSDFDFDENDGQNSNNEMSGDENNEPVRCETILSVPSENENSTIVQDSNDKNDAKESNEIIKATEAIASHSSHESEQNNDTNANPGKTSKCTESNGIPITVDSSNLELQEIILPSGEVVQCYSSTIGNNSEIGGGQYYIIPNVNEQNNSGDHEYSVIQADSLPAVLQNLETSQVHLQQDQLIFIANNSSDQVECNETEVTSA